MTELSSTNFSRSYLLRKSHVFSNTLIKRIELTLDLIDLLLSHRPGGTQRGGESLDFRADLIDGFVVSFDLLSPIANLLILEIELLGEEFKFGSECIERNTNTIEKLSIDQFFSQFRLRFAETYDSTSDSIIWIYGCNNGYN